MKLSKKYAGLLAAAALVVPTASLGQEAVTDQANAVSETAQELQDEANTLADVTAEAEGAATADVRDDDDRRDHRDDDFPWGLLGLLGLAGLLGLKKRDDHHHRDVHVDTRHDTHTRP